MLVKNTQYRSIWRVGSDFSTPVSNFADGAICLIDQRWLPHRFEIVELRNSEDAFFAIREMQVRGAPLIGATAGYGVYLAALETGNDAEAFYARCNYLLSARPTAVNLAWAIERQKSIYQSISGADERLKALLLSADAICEEDVETNSRIGMHGLEIIKQIASRKAGSGPVNIMTHCNAGWLATVDWGTATAPIYKAAEAGIEVHVWVDETRPRNQGARLTAWEMVQQGIPHTLIVDNAGGHLMQHGQVDLLITGTDRTTYTGDVCNKIGTYLKALAAHDNGIPFYVALPGSTIDWEMKDGLAEIPIEERNGHEVSHLYGKAVAGAAAGETGEFLICPPETPVSNHSFDVTPSRLVSGLITERGLCDASSAGLYGLYPEKSPAASEA